MAVPAGVASATTKSKRLPSTPAGGAETHAAGAAKRIQASSTHMPQQAREHTETIDIFTLCALEALQLDERNLNDFDGGHIT
jgi:hypothetical protein